MDVKTPTKNAMSDASSRRYPPTWRYGAVVTMLRKFTAKDTDASTVVTCAIVKDPMRPRNPGTVLCSTVRSAATMSVRPPRTTMPMPQNDQVKTIDSRYRVANGTR